MRMRNGAPAAALILLAAAFAGCGDDPTAPPPALAAIVVVLDITGDTPNPGGYQAVLDATRSLPIHAGERVMFDAVDPGSHVVRLVGVASYCTLASDNPRTMSVAVGDTAEVWFHGTCGNPLPDLHMAGMEVLGSGYNIGGNYADVADVREHVLDLTALARDQLLRQVLYERASYDVVSGETSRDYLRNLQVKVGVEGQGWGFSGAVKAGFSQERYESVHYSFATVRSVIRKHGLRVPLSVTPEQLRQYLTPAAAAAINDAGVDPLDLFRMFGTHVLRGIIVGGRLDYTTSANMSFERQDRTIDVYARVAFKSVFASASIETQVIDDQSQSEFSATQTTHLEVYGGRSEYGQYIVNAGQYESWVESVDENAVFMDFESTGLMGIWELAQEPGRRAALQAAWEFYSDAYGITLAQAGRIASDFPDDPDGWTYYDWHGNVHSPVHGVQDGFFGGYIVGEEGEHATRVGWDGMMEYVDWWLTGLQFSAPSKFLGDKTPYAGGTLEYWLWYSPSLVPWIWELDGYRFRWQGSILNFVTVLSENGNLVFVPDNGDFVPDERFRPGNVFPSRTPTRFVIHLTPGAQGGEDSVTGIWRRWDWEEATESDIWRSMASIRAIKIWGDFIEGNDRVALDRVSLNAPVAVY